MSAREQLDATYAYLIEPNYNEDPESVQKRRHKIDELLGRVEQITQPNPAGLGVSELGLMTLFGMETAEKVDGM